MRNFVFTILVLIISMPATGRAQTGGSATVTIQADHPGAPVSSNLFGIFFEEINYAGDGGLYAEMVRNRSFYDANNPLFWTLATSGTATGTMAVDPTMPLNTNIPNSLKLTMLSGSGSVGAANSGYWGMSLQAGATYDLSFYARTTNNFSGVISARLESADGSKVYSQAGFVGVNAVWRRFSAALISSDTDTNARLVICISQPGTIWLDMVSLFPRATFNGRTNGLRADLANLLAALHPSFMRYPGGNFIESFNVTNAVRWKKTIGDIAQRPGHMNDSWGYWSTDGFGLEEYLQFCEDLGMEPLYAINAGLCLGYDGNTNNTVPMDQMGPWVQDALDLIEYCNGDTNTTWGAVRAANGHPAPFHLKYLEIGNENGGPLYDERYALFYDAIKSNYPDVHLIAPDWGGIPTSRPVEIQDEHYYSSPQTFISYATKYDSYSRSRPKVFVGEYAVTSGYGTYGNLAAALGEAAFMTGMERNSDIVLMASYAPLFANVNGIQWHPDLIYFDNSRAFGTPSYYVQKMFSENRGDMVLPMVITNTQLSAGAGPHGAIGVGSWNTAVQYTNLVVTSNGVVLYQSDFVHQGTNGWRVYNGAWSVNAGLYQQTALTTDCRSTTGDTNWANYTITLKARKIGGAEGFLILFNWTDDNDWTWWNVGGWNNTLDGIEQMVGGTKTVLAQVPQTAIATNVWYDIRIVLTGPRIQCYLNGALVQDFTYPSGLLASSTYSKSSGQIIVKAVNPYSQSLAATFNLAGVTSLAPTGTVVQLTSAGPADENSFAAPTHVFPTTNSFSIAGTNFALTLPANSLSILRLPATVNFFTNLLLQVPSPITNGLTVAFTVWGEQSGNWFNLTTNVNHALVWSAADSNIARVDIAGNVTGINSGTTAIVVRYPALDLSATQFVQVVTEPVRLVHRYSFSETNGTRVTDSVGGPAWDGTLLNGGTWTGGQLQLQASSSQYVQLPAGILSNYAAVTIEAWVTFPDQLPVNCFFFGFGGTNGTQGNGYIFCAPRAGRIAITSTNYTGEQNAYSGADFSFQTNFHFVAVFNPPAGYLALYTNGTLAAINNAVTVPLSSINDVFNYIGRSLYSADPYPDLTLDEFRIYDGALSPAEIAATQALGPDRLLSDASPVFNPPQTAGNNLLLSWPLASAGFTLLSRTDLIEGAWTPVTSPAPQIVGGQWEIPLPVTNGPHFFRLEK